MDSIPGRNAEDNVRDRNRLRRTGFRYFAMNSTFQGCLTQLCWGIPIHDNFFALVGTASGLQGGCSGDEG